VVQKELLSDKRFSNVSFIESSLYQEVRKLGNFYYDTVKNAIESGSVKVLPLNQSKGQFTKIPVNNDLKILDQSKAIQNAFKSGELPSLKDIQKVLKIKFLE
jgi:hypothetical protein